MIILTAESKAWKVTRQYIAHIVGRDNKFQFRREFTGTKDGSTTRAYVDEPGLYEICDIDKKDRKGISYFAVIPRPADCPPLSETADSEWLRLYLSEEKIAGLAKRLDSGESVADMLTARVDGERYVAVIRSKGETKRASAAFTVNTAIEQCWTVLQALPAKEAKQVLAALKAKLAPPKPEPVESQPADAHSEAKGGQ